MEERSFTFKSIEDDSCFCITITRYENGDAESLDDANWLEASVDVTARPFAASFSCSMRTETIAGLLLRLQAFGGGDISFSTMEGEVDIIIKKGNNQCIVLYGVITGGNLRQNILNFSFVIDESVLLEASKNVQSIMDAYPVIERLGS